MGNVMYTDVDYTSLDDPDIIDKCKYMDASVVSGKVYGQLRFPGLIVCINSNNRFEIHIAKSVSDKLKNLRKSNRLNASKGLCILHGIDDSYKLLAYKLSILLTGKGFDYETYIAKLEECAEIAIQIKNVRLGVPQTYKTMPELKPTYPGIVRVETHNDVYVKASSSVIQGLRDMPIRKKLKAGDTITFIKCENEFDKRLIQAYYQFTENVKCKYQHKTKLVGEVKE